jgi:hypothetical protein
MKKIIFFLNCILSISIVNAGFTGDTVVPILNNFVLPIKLFEKKDKLLSFNGTGVSEQVVEFVQYRKVNDLFRITTCGGDVIDSSKDARFLLPKHQQWGYACDLRPGQWLLQQNMEGVKVKSVEKITKPAEVFDIGVSNYHNFGVSKNGIIVHNMSQGVSLSVQLVLKYLGLMATPPTNGNNTQSFDDFVSQWKKNHIDQNKDETPIFQPMLPQQPKCLQGGCKPPEKLPPSGRDPLDEIHDNAVSEKETESPGHSDLFCKQGGFGDALKDFESLDLANIKSIKSNTGFTGTLLDGRQVNVRWGSEDGRPTFEIYDPIKKKRIKYRYGEKPKDGKKPVFDPDVHGKLLDNMFGGRLGRPKQPNDKIQDNLNSSDSDVISISPNQATTFTVPQTQNTSFWGSIYDFFTGGSNSQPIENINIWPEKPMFIDDNDIFGGTDNTLKPSQLTPDKTDTINSSGTTTSPSIDKPQPNSGTQNTGETSTGTDTKKETPSTGARWPGGNFNPYQPPRKPQKINVGTKQPVIQTVPPTYDPKVNEQILKDNLGISKLPDGKDLQDNTGQHIIYLSRETISQFYNKLKEAEKPKKFSTEIPGLTEDEVNEMIANRKYWDYMREQNGGNPNSSALKLEHDPKKFIEFMTGMQNLKLSQDVQDAIEKAKGSNDGTKKPEGDNGTQDGKQSPTGDTNGSGKGKLRDALTNGGTSDGKKVEGKEAIELKGNAPSDTSKPVKGNGMQNGKQSPTGDTRGSGKGKLQDTLTNGGMPDGKKVEGKEAIKLTPPSKDKLEKIDFTTPEPYRSTEEPSKVSVIVTDNGTSIHYGSSGNKPDAFNGPRKEGWVEGQDLENAEKGARQAIAEVKYYDKLEKLNYSDLTVDQKRDLDRYREWMRTEAFATYEYQIKENGHPGYGEIKPKKIGNYIFHYSEAQGMASQEIDGVLDIYAKKLREKMAALDPKDVPAFKQKHKCNDQGEALPGYSVDGTVLFVRANMIVENARVLKAAAEHVKKMQGSGWFSSNPEEEQAEYCKKNHCTRDGRSSQGYFLNVSGEYEEVKIPKVEQKTFVEVSKKIPLNPGLAKPFDTMPKSEIDAYLKYGRDDLNKKQESGQTQQRRVSVLVNQITGSEAPKIVTSLNPGLAKPFDTMTKSEIDAYLKYGRDEPNEQKNSQTQQQKSTQGVSTQNTPPKHTEKSWSETAESVMEDIGDACDKVDKVLSYTVKVWKIYDFFLEYKELEEKYYEIHCPKWDKKNSLESQIVDQHDLNVVLASNNIKLTEEQRHFIGERYDYALLFINVDPDSRDYLQKISINAQECRQNNLILHQEYVFFDTALKGLQDIIDVAEARKMELSNEPNAITSMFIRKTVQEPEAFSKWKAVVEQEYKINRRYLSEEDCQKLDVLLESNNIKVEQDVRLRLEKQCAINLKENPDYFDGWVLDLNASNKAPNTDTIRNMGDVWKSRRLRTSPGSLLASQYGVMLDKYTIAFLRERQKIRSDLTRDIKKKAELFVDHTYTIDGTYSNKKYSQKLDDILAVNKIKLTQSLRLKIERQLAMNCHISPKYRDAFERYDTKINVLCIATNPDVVRNIQDLFTSVHTRCVNEFKCGFLQLIFNQYNSTNVFVLLYKYGTGNVVSPQEQYHNLQKSWLEKDVKFKNTSILELSDETILQEAVNEAFKKREYENFVNSKSKPTEPDNVRASRAKMEKLEKQYEELRQQKLFEKSSRTQEQEKLGDAYIIKSRM